MYEARDASALIDMLAQQPEVQLDKPGDPHLGMIGASYGGGIQLVTAAIDPRVDVITPQIAWNSLITSLDKSNTAKGGWGSLAGRGWDRGIDDRGVERPGRLRADRAVRTPTPPSAFAGRAGHRLSSPPPTRPTSQARGPDSLLSHIHIPTLLMEGTDDTLFTLHEAITNFKALQANGVPVQMLWFCGWLTGGPTAHGVCNTPVGPDPAHRHRLRAALAGPLPQGQRRIGRAAVLVGLRRGGAARRRRTTRPPRARRSRPPAPARWSMATGDVSGALIEAEPRDATRSA